jgi:RNA polymerase sigma-70 factor (ECF subfamily)
VSERTTPEASGATPSVLRPVVGDAIAPASPYAVIEAEALAHLDRGDSRGALIVLMRAYGDAVLGHCVRSVRDRALAEDIRQQVFLEAFRDLPRFQRRSTLRCWILGIASHRCLDAIKARRRRDARIDSGEEEAVVEAVAESPDPAHHVDRERTSRVLEDCLEGLSDEVRMTVLMKYQLGLSYEEMSPMVNQRPGTLQARVARALPVLRRCLENKGVAP